MSLVWGWLALVLRVVDVLHRQIELVSVVLGLAAVLGAPIGEDALQPDALLVEEGEPPDR